MLSHNVSQTHLQEIFSSASDRRPGSLERPCHAQSIVFYQLRCFPVLPGCLVDAVFERSAATLGPLQAGFQNARVCVGS